MKLIHIELDRLEGTLLRILGLVERRGFHIDGLELYDLDEETRGLSITVRPRDAARSLDTLGLQIDRLYGIKRVQSARAALKTAETPTSSAQKISA